MHIARGWNAARLGYRFRGFGSTPIIATDAARPGRETSLMDRVGRAALDFFNGAGAASLDKLIEAFAEVARAAAFSSAACFHIARPGEPIAPRLLFGWNLAAQDLRQLEQRMARQDEAIRALFMSSDPARWSDIDGASAGRPEFTTPLDGLLVPVHGPMGEILCVAILGAGARTLETRARMTLQTAAILLANRGEALAEVDAETSADERPSRREAQCALLAGEGKSDWEIGRILRMSEGAVALHLDRLKSKLGVSHRSEIPPRVWLNVEQQDD